ncbi:hypothetical protein LSAT2_008856, partial [Lamellibrachia satsuma]
LHILDIRQVRQLCAGLQQSKSSIQELDLTGSTVFSDVEAGHLLGATLGAKLGLSRLRRVL